jgi:hypothetical protein
MSRLNSGNAYYYSVQNLILKKLKMNMYKAVNCNFASCAVWVRNLVSHFGGGTKTDIFSRTEC